MPLCSFHTFIQLSLVELFCLSFLFLKFYMSNKSNEINETIFKCNLGEGSINNIWILFKIIIKKCTYLYIYTRPINLVIKSI